MSKKKLHIIQKQVIDITLPNATAALEWEITQRRDFTTLINKQLERCFDDYDKNGNHLIIERLDIDLGIFTTNDLREEMPGRLYSKLYKILEEHSREAITGIRDTESYYSETSKADRFYSGLQGQLEALFFFLDKGHLPWWGSELGNWDENWLRSLSENEILRFKTFISLGDEKPVKRLTTQFNDSFIEQLLQRFGITDETTNAWHWLQTLLKNLMDVDDSSRRTYSDNIFESYQKSLLPAVVRAEFWLNWILHAVGKREIPTLHKLFTNSPKALEIINSAIKSKYDNHSLKTPGKIPSHWEKEVGAIIKQPQKAQEKRTDKMVNKKAHFAEEIKPVAKHKESLPMPAAEDGIIEKYKDTSSKPADKTRETENEAEAIFVSNAGLIILHPFLPELFRHCGWLEKNKFIDDYAQTMAVYALHYLATGETDVPEHQLMFPKFLTGMAWEAPLDPVEPLNDKEQAACHELLEEVLKHWKPLRNTSPQGLREAYLQRNGKLEHIYSGWHLSIELKTLDILLNRLPWGISMINLPWMTQPLTVAWQ